MSNDITTTVNETETENETGLAVMKPMDVFKPLTRIEDIGERSEEGLKFEAMDPNSYAVMAAKANMANGEQLDSSIMTRIKTPSAGGTKWEVPTADGVKMVDEIVGAFVFQELRGVLWGSDNVAAGQSPIMTTGDMQVAHQIERIPDDMAGPLATCKNPDGTYSWTKISELYSSLKTGGKQKRAKDQRVICVLPYDKIWPLILNVQPGSIFDFRSFIHSLGDVYWRSVISLKLVKEQNKSGIAYSKIVPTRIAKLSIGEARFMLGNYTNRLIAASNNSAFSEPADTPIDE